MTISLLELVTDVRRLVNDPDGDRWTDTTLFTAINSQVKRAIVTGSGINTKQHAWTLNALDQLSQPVSGSVIELDAPVALLHSIRSIISDDATTIVATQLYEASFDELNQETPNWQNDDPGVPIHFTVPTPGDREFYLWPPLDLAHVDVTSVEFTVTADVFPLDVGPDPDFVGPVINPELYPVEGFIQLELHPKYKEAIVNMTAVRLTEDVPEVQGTERALWWANRANELLGLDVQYRSARRQANKG